MATLRTRSAASRRLFCGAAGQHPAPQLLVVGVSVARRQHRVAPQAPFGPDGRGTLGLAVGLCHRQDRGVAAQDDLGPAAARTWNPGDQHGRLGLVAGRGASGCSESWPSTGSTVPAAPALTTTFAGCRRPTRPVTAPGHDLDGMPKMESCRSGSPSSLPPVMADHRRASQAVRVGKMPGRARGMHVCVRGPGTSMTGNCKDVRRTCLSSPSRCGSVRQARNHA